MLICFFGGWRGEWFKLPHADFYVCTGNMLKECTPEKNKTATNRKMNRRREIYSQGKEVTNLLNRRSLLGNPGAPVYFVRGGKDFVSLAKLYEGGKVEEIEAQKVITNVTSLKITGFGGVTWSTGSRANEKSTAQFEALTNALPEADILVTHLPSYSVGNFYGLLPLHRYIEAESKLRPLKIHAYSGRINDFGTSYNSTYRKGKRGSELLSLACAGGYHLVRWETGVITVVQSLKVNYEKNHSGGSI